MNRLICHRRKRQRRARAFTLVEMLVAVAVMGLLVAMITQIIAMASKAITGSIRQLDGVTQARLALDRIDMDIAAQPKRSDLGVTFSKGSGNDQFSFYSEVRGYGGVRNFSIVGYRIQESDVDHLFELERGAQGCDWSGTTAVVYSPKSLPAIEESNYEVLSGSVFRMEFCYLKTDGTFSNSAQADLSNVSAVVVAIAVLDLSSRKMLASGGIKTLSEALPDSEEGVDSLTTWRAAMEQSGFATGIPRQAVQSIRLYQRYFYVH